MWPCATADPAPGGGTIPGWLHTAIVRIVTRYSAPGDRVLLVAPHTGAGTHAARWPAAGRRPWHRYDGLVEAAWTIARLGRGIHTSTASPAADAPAVEAPVRPPRGEADAPDPGAAGEATSVPRPPRLEGPVDRSNRDKQQRPGQPEARPDGGSSGQFPLIVTAVDPGTSERASVLDLVHPLAPSGVLAVITHTEYRPGRWSDPAPALLAASHHAGLACLDHVILLNTPARTDHIATQGGGQGPGPVPVVVHADLYLFVRTSTRPGTAHD